MERNVDAVTPMPPNVETRRKPIDEQLAQVLEIILSVEHENSELRYYALVVQQLAVVT